MRVDSSLLGGIAAATPAVKASSSSPKPSGTAGSFSSALKSESEKETTQAVAGRLYSEILTGARAGMYVNTSGNARAGEAFVLVKHDGREDHVYGTGKDRVVVGGSGDTESAAPTDTEAASGTADGGETSKPVSGRGYADILTGRRSDLYLNTCGNVRDGRAFVLVQRDSREYHIYGTGKDRQVIGLRPPASATTPSDAATPTTPTTPTVTDPPKTGTSVVDSTA
jgi:hypothetical protein